VAREGVLAGILEGLELERVETPAYVCDLGALRRNLKRLAHVQVQGGCKVLLALKGFAMWSVFPTIREVLSGVAASSPDEARLGAEEFGREVHVYAPAFSEQSLRACLPYVDHVVFNSVHQWRTLGPLVKESSRAIEVGLRLNPQHSEVAVPIYDPCALYSRLGTTQVAMGDDELDGLDGLHFHTLCELGADALIRTTDQVCQRFGKLLSRVRWLNLGGGHHITRPNYDMEALIELINALQSDYGLEIYLEPGEAIALNTGALVASVLDIVDNEMKIAILDTSASAHMPDVLEMPYRPQVVGAGTPGERTHTYRLTGSTCLAGDVIGDYSFDHALRRGDRLVFLDMAHYTMVKNTTFNGIRLPDIATWDPDKSEYRVVRRFGYEDYRNRLS
jgi:carboxynorspermidine decarboxylase